MTLISLVVDLRSKMRLGVFESRKSHRTPQNSPGVRHKRHKGYSRGRRCRPPTQVRRHVGETVQADVGSEESDERMNRLGYVYFILFPNVT